MNNNFNSVNKKQRAVIAECHTQQMQKQYSKEIAECIESTVIYDHVNVCQIPNNNLDIGYRLGDTVSVLFHEELVGKTALLNFASYRHPGGGFIVGSKAQEEALCHESFLYNVLKSFEDSYYGFNRSHLNNGSYMNRALYSHNVLFIKNNLTKYCDVITCAAPNFSASKQLISKKENQRILRERIRFVLGIAQKEGVDTFIAGSWGCGVFQQDPNEVAKLFIEEAVSIGCTFKLIFALLPPNGKSPDNTTPFIEAINVYKKKIN